MGILGKGGLLLAVLVAILGGEACARRVVLDGTPLAPAAVADLRLRRDENRNTVVSLEVAHLAPPGRLPGGVTTYVVWVDDPEGTAWANVGALEVGEDRSGRLRFTTPLRMFKIRITAEKGVSVRQPGEAVMVDAVVDAGD